MRILVIEDDLFVSRSIELMLGSAGLEHDTTASGKDGVELAQMHQYDAILLDLSLPDLHGYEVLQALRVAEVRTPVIILTGTDGLDTKVECFGLGADDYVTKPFQRTELLARVHAVMRRSKCPVRSIVQTGSLSVDLLAQTVAVAGRRVQLTSKEYTIIEMLSLRKGATLTKEMFMAHLYGGRDEPEYKIIDVFICKLRKKLVEAGAGPSGYIETVWGRGYALRDPEVPAPWQIEAA